MHEIAAMAPNPSPSFEPEFDPRMRVAIVHYWLVGMRGGEKVIEALCELFPNADIFTHVYLPDSISPEINRHKVTTTFVSRLPRPARNYKLYLPFMPMALEQLDLRGYDLVISSESGPAKGVVAPPGATHVCYCHSPMRYVWNMFHDYQEKSGLLSRMVRAPLLHYIRTWDAVSAMRVDAFAANSRTVATRIKAYWRRESEIIFPPVDIGAFSPAPESELQEFYLMAGELVRYKRPDIAVEAFNTSKRQLVVIGGGEMLEELKSKAGPTVRMLGPQPFAVLRQHYARCKALIFPGEEDFGMVPVEAMASGRPVIGFGRGGVTETVVEGVTGTFFHQQTVECLLDAVERFRDMEFDPSDAVSRAKEFSKARFKEHMTAFIQKSMIARQTG